MAMEILGIRSTLTETRLCPSARATTSGRFRELPKVNSYAAVESLMLV